MNTEILFDAMNEISDKHIAEVATYKPKAKALPLKKLIVTAACIGVVAASALAVMNTGSRTKPTASSPDSTYPSTTAPTTVAAIDKYTTEISQEPTSTTMAYTPPVVSGTVAGTTASVTTTQNYMPPGFDASVMLEQSENLGEFCEKADFTAQSSYWVSYEQKDKEAVIYSICVSTVSLIDKLITNNYDKKAEIRQSTTDEAIVFESSLYDIKGIVTTRLCNDGYLYITCKDVTRGYNIGTDAYKKFMDEFESLSCIYTPEHPVTLA